MPLADITKLIIEYRYVILAPLSIIEGPIVAFAAGALAPLGYFNVYILAVFFLVMDVAKDVFYYSLGYWGGKSGWAHWLLGKIGVRTEHLEGVKELWEKNPGKTMFIGKLSYGIASTFVVLAGTVKMSLKKFFGWGVIVAISQYWTLLAVGYFFGTSLSSTNIIEDAQYVVGGVALVGSLYYILTIYMRGRLNKDRKNG